jgi:hypothetical protein
MAIVIPPAIPTGQGDGQFLSTDPNNPALNARAGFGGDIWGAFGGGFIPEQSSSRAHLVQVSGAITQGSTPVVTDPNKTPIYVGMSTGSLPAGSIPPNAQVFTAQGAYTWVKPNGAVKVTVVLLGPGGGGGAGATFNSGPAGGGGGGGGEQRTKTYLASALAATVAGFNGAPGLGGASDPANGTTGTASTFNNNDMIANPGTFGSSFAHSSTQGGGGTGGTGGTGIDGGAGGQGRQPQTGGDPGLSVGGSYGGGGGGGSTIAGPPGPGGSSGVQPGGTSKSSTVNSQIVAAGIPGFGGGGGGVTDRGTNTNCTLIPSNGGSGEPGAGRGGGGGGSGAANGAGAIDVLSSGGNGSPGSTVIVTFFS